MLIKSLKVIDGRNYLNGQKLSHIVWNHYHPDDPWTPGHAIHHIDENPLNDWHENLDKLKLGDHGRIHNSGDKGYWYGKTGPNKNMVVSDETKKKIGLKSLGNKNWLGKKHSEETKLKISKSGKGHLVSEETKINISKAKKGRVAKNKGISMMKEQKLKISQSLKQYWANKKLGLV